MDIRLRRLELRNFKGVAAFTLEPGDGDVTIRGRNGAGKSSVADALNWLLFDKNQAGEKAFSIKTIGKDGESLHDLEHGVAGTFRLEPEGRELTLEKILREKWTKKRGSGEREFQGHETAYAVDGVPRKKGEFDEAVAALCPEEPFRLLTSTTYFNALKWQDRRRILLEVSGTVTDAEVIEAHEGLQGVTELLDGRSLEDSMKVLKARRPKINSAIDLIPARIDEVKRSMPEAGEATPPVGGKPYAALKAELQKLQNDRAAELAGDTTGAREEALRLRQEMATADEEHRNAVQAAQAERAQYSAAIEQGEVSLKRQMEIIERAQADVAGLELANEKLRGKWNATTEAQPPEAICRTCGQALPEERAEEIRSQFRGRKAEELKQIEEEGKENVRAIEERKAEVSKREAEIRELLAEQELARDAADSVTMPEAPDHSEALQRIAAIEKSMEGKATPETERIDAKIEEARSAIEALDRFAENLKRAGEAEGRIKELQAEKKRLGLELDEIERSLNMLEEFTRAKVAMLTNAVEKRFAQLSFRLFTEQVNGGIAETCETLVPSPAGAPVPWGDANTGARVQAGLQIIKVLAEHYGLTAPVFIDNAESLTAALSPQPSQRIRLIADAACPELRLELDEPILQAS